MGNNFADRLKQASLASKNDIAHLMIKIDFDDKLKDINKKFPSSKRKHIGLKAHNFIIDRLQHQF